MSHSIIALFLMNSEYYKIKRLYSVLMQNIEKGNEWLYNLQILSLYKNGLNTGSVSYFFNQL